MKTIEQTRRELFEAAYCKRNECGIDHMQKDGKFYQRDSAQMAWGWFNAALDAVVINIPESREIIDEGGWLSDVVDADEVRTAIESTNLGLKII